VKYRVQGSQLYIDDGIRPVTYNFKLTQNSLVLSGAGMKKTLTFNRPGSVKENSIASEKNTTSNQNQNQNQNQFQRETGTAYQNQNRNQNNFQDSQGQSANKNTGNAMLTGVWQGPGGKMIFYPDATMFYNSVAYNYSFTANQLTISGNDGSISFNSALSGNSLSLSQNGNKALYNKVASLRPEGIDQQLVGKWCILSSNYNSYAGGGSSSEECITLNSDGTYIYSYSAERTGYATGQSAYGGTANQNGDRGTWKTDGETISSHSQTTGKVNRYTFSKENNQNGDPVIVIGGKKFVSAYNRPGWR
jgi:hypothetical protein